MYIYSIHTKVKISFCDRDFYFFFQRFDILNGSFSDTGNTFLQKDRKLIHKSQFKFFHRKMKISLEKMSLPLPEMEDTEKLTKSRRKLINVASATAIITLLTIWGAVILLFIVQCSHEQQVSRKKEGK